MFKMIYQTSLKFKQTFALSENSSCQFQLYFQIKTK